MSVHKEAAGRRGKPRQRFWPGDTVMTPVGLGIVKFVFPAGGSQRRQASYAVTLPHRRPGVIFLEPELQHLTTGPSIDCADGQVGGIQKKS